MRQLVYTMFISNNRASFHLWWKEHFVKHQKVSKYYENDCRQIHNRGINIQATFQDIASKSRLCIKSSNPWGTVCRGFFSTEYAVCAVNLTNNISRSGWTWRYLWKILIINFKNKYFLNSVDLSGLFFKYISLYDCQKF